jgi:ribose transport system substrate-binding protein
MWSRDGSAKRDAASLACSHIAIQFVTAKHPGLPDLPLPKEPARNDQKAERPAPDLQLVDGEALQVMVVRMFNSPPDVVEVARKPSGTAEQRKSEQEWGEGASTSSAGNREYTMKYHGAWFAAVIAGLMPFGPALADGETIGVFTKSSGNPIARAVRAGADAIGKAYGVTVVHYIPTSADNVLQQTALVDEALRAKRDAIVLTPVDVKAMVPAVQKINAAGIPVVNVSDRISRGDTVAFVGTDDYGIALDTARKLFKAMGGKGNLVILEGPETIPTAVGRLRGFKDALKEFPDVKVLFSKSAAYARPAATDLLRAMLKTTPPPQIDGVLAANDAMAFGAIEAFKEAKKKTLIVGINASKEAVDFIKAGDMLASGDYNGLVEGCLGTEIAIRTLRKQPVPKEVMARTAVVDATNYQAYEIPAERRPCPTLESMVAR